MGPARPAIFARFGDTFIVRTGTMEFGWGSTWPHSAAAIERTMSHLTDEERAKILGLNAARVFKFDVPQDKVR